MSIYTAGLWLYAGLVPVTFLTVAFVTAPYGRHAREGWGPTLPERCAWIVMESPSVWVALAVYLSSTGAGAVVPTLLLGVWLLHYVQRTYVYPFLIRARDRRMPALVAGLAFLYTSFNAWMNFTWVAELAHYELSWLWDPRLLIGLALSAVGLGINLYSDHLLRSLREPGETGYRIPRGFLYDYVSCPNYLGELLEWLGWALMTWSLPGLLFALYTAANLGPRAIAHHRWYRREFPDYPAKRRALIPFLL